MSVMHQLPRVAANLVSPLKLEGDTVNIFNTQGHFQANIENLLHFFSFLFSCLSFPSSLPSLSLFLKRLWC